MDELLTGPQVTKILKTNSHAFFDLINQQRLKALQLGVVKNKSVYAATASCRFGN